MKRENAAMKKRMEAIGKNVKRYRQLKGITQDQLAFASYIRSRSYISMVETGHFVPSLGSLLQIAEALTISPAFLLIDSELDSDDGFLCLYKELEPRQKTEVKRFVTFLLKEKTRS